MTLNRTWAAGTQARAKSLTATPTVTPGILTSLFLLLLLCDETVLLKRKYKSVDVADY